MEKGVKFTKFYEIWKNIISFGGFRNFFKDSLKNLNILTLIK